MADSDKREGGQVPRVPEPFNVHAFVVKPSGHGAGVTFVRQQVIQVLEVEWEWYAMGGPGAAVFKIEGELTDAATAITDEWELLLETRLESEIDYTTWYRGIITVVKAEIIGGKTISRVVCKGYWSTQLNRVHVDSDTTAATTVSNLLLNVVSTQNVDDETRVVWDATKVDASAYSVASFDVKGPPNRAIKALAEIQGSREAAIIPDTRKLEFRATSTTVAERNNYIVGHNVKEVDSGDSHVKGTTRLVMVGHPRGGAPNVVSRADATAETADGIKALRVILPWLSATADLNRWADNKLTDFKAKQQYSVFDVPDVKARVEGTGPPYGNIRLWRSPETAASVKVELPLHRVQYKLGLACRAEYDIPDCTPEEIRPKGYSLSARVWIGEPPPTIAEVYDKVEEEKERITQWIDRFNDPETGDGLPATFIPADRRWDGQLFSDTSGIDLYMYDATATSYKIIGGEGVVFIDATQTLTNKSLVDASTYVIDDVDNTKKLQFQVSGVTTGTTRTLTVPDASTTIVGTDTTQTLTNKSLVDASTYIVDDADNTKKLQFQASGITTGTTRTLTAPNASATIAGLEIANVFTADQTVQSAAATTGVTIDNTAVDGDPILGFALSGTNAFTMGVDDGDGDKFKIGTTTIGTNTRITIDSAGQLGFGTTTPGAPVDIVDPAAAAVENEILRLRYTTSALDGDGGKISFTNASGTELGNIVNRIESGSAVGLSFGTYNSGMGERVRIAASGLVTLTENLAFKSGTANAMTLDHAATADRAITFPDASTTVVGTDTTQTLTNKSLVDASTYVIDDVDNTKKMQFQVSGVTTGTTRTFTVPDASTTIVGTDTTQTLTNKTLIDASTYIADDADNTKKLQFQVSGVTTGTTRTLTAPDASATIAGLEIANVFTADQTVQSAAATTGVVIDNTAVDGDPILAFALSGTKTFTMGVDDGDSDKFKIGTTAIGTSTRLTIDSTGRVGIGTVSPDALLDIVGDPNGTVRVTSTESDVTSKVLNLVIPQYTNANGDFRAMGATTNSGYNIVDIGGGYDGYDAATLIRLYTAATLDANTGTERMTIGSTGLVTLSENLAFKSGTAFTVTLDHAATANRTITFPDTDMTVIGTGANTLTANQTFQGTEPTLIFDNTTVSSDDYHIRNKVLASSNLEIYNATDDRIDFQVTGIGDVAIGDVGATGGLIFVDQSAAFVGIKTTTPADALDVNGDVRATGGFKHSFTFHTEDLPADNAGFYLAAGGSPSAGSASLILPYAGSVLAIGVASANGPRTAGTATFTVRNNGVSIGLSAALNATDPALAYTTQAKDTDTFAAGSTLEVDCVTVGWNPTTVDVVATVVVEM